MRSWQGTNLLGKVLMRVRLALYQGPIVIGIAGVTRSGKSSLASGLAKVLGVPENLIVHQDKSWKPPRDRPRSARFNKPDMECPDSVDWARLKGWIRERVEQAKAQQLKFVIVEGFLLFSDPEIRDMCHRKIFVTVPKQVAYERRMRTKFVNKDEFDELIWPSFVRYNSHVFHMPDVFICNGCCPAQTMVDECVQFLNGREMGQLHFQELKAALALDDHRNVDVVRRHSPSPDRRRDDQRRKRSRSPQYRHRSRSRSRERRHRSRTPEKKRRPRSRSRERSRTPEKKRRSRSRSREKKVSRTPEVYQLRMDAINSNLEKSSGKPAVVLVATGSYCPPHKVV